MASLQLAQLGFAVGDLVFAHLFPQNLTADAECGGGVLAAPVVGVQRREDTAALFFAAIATTSTPTAIAIPAIATISRLALERIALQAGKHVYVEKPLSLSLAGAISIAKAAQMTGRQVMVGHLIRYHAAFREL